jgi:hypothetical protein
VVKLERTIINTQGIIIMSIKTTYNLHNVQIPNAIIRIDRLWGSSKEGWTALVGVYTTETVPAAEAVGVEGEDGYMPATPETTRMNKITDFNRHAPYNADERGYVTAYAALMAEFGGVEV